MRNCQRKIRLEPEIPSTVEKLHEGNAYARSCRIGKLPAMLPLFETMKQLDVLKFNRTVGLLKCCGTDADEMVAGSYLPSESAANMIIRGVIWTVGAK